MEWILNKNMAQIEWFGRGPQENYPDRKTGYKTGIYTSTVAAMYEPYLLPEDYGLRTENRWVKITDTDGVGLQFSGNQWFNFNAYPYSTENLSKATYPYQLQESDGITFNFDYATSGVGCTALSVFNHYRVFPQQFHFTTTIKLVQE
jgi:beta-galactosidase